MLLSVLSRRLSLARRRTFVDLFVRTTALLFCLLWWRFGCGGAACRLDNVLTFQARDLATTQLGRNKVTPETKLILSHAAQCPFASPLRPPFLSLLPRCCTVAIVIYSRPPRLLFHRLRRTQPERRDKAYPTRRM
jgi:hypothetical protein